MEWFGGLRVEAISHNDDSDHGRDEQNHADPDPSAVGRVHLLDQSDVRVTEDKHKQRRDSADLCAWRRSLQRSLENMNDPI